VVCLAFLVAMVGLTVVASFLMIITAYIVYRLCDREFRGLNAVSGDA
jgi:cobalamin synthase